MTLNDWPDVLDVGEAATLLRVSKSFMYKELKKSNPRLPKHFRYGRKYFFLKLEVLSFILSK